MDKEDLQELKKIIFSLNNLINNIIKKQGDYNVAFILNKISYELQVFFEWFK